MPEGHLHRLARDQSELVGSVRIRLAGDRPPRRQVRVRRATPAAAWDFAGRTAYACPTCPPR